MLKNWRMWVIVGLCPLLNGCIVVQFILFNLCLRGLAVLELSEGAGNSCDVFFTEARECLGCLASCAVDPSGEPCSCPPRCVSLGAPEPTPESSSLADQWLTEEPLEQVFSGTAKTHLPYGEPANFTLSLGTDTAGQTTSLQASFMTAADRLQTHQEQITVPAAFGFAGFTALGPADTQIGTYTISMDLFMGPLSMAVPIRVRDANQAYLDGDDSGSFNADFDATITHTMDMTGNHIFTILTPFGGDGLPEIQTELVAAEVLATLNNGLLTNPSAPGTYTLHTELTSIDTDTGGADDGAGHAPQQVSIDRAVSIVPLTAIPTVPQWGLLLLTLALLSLATWQLIGQPLRLGREGTGATVLIPPASHWPSSLLWGQGLATGGLLLYALFHPLVPHDGLGTLLAGFLLGVMMEAYRRRP